MAILSKTFTKPLLITVACMGLSACDGDFDMRGVFNGHDTSSAARGATQARPKADSRGIIAYPNYQVVEARSGDTVASVAARIGVSPQSLAKHNGVATDTPLRKGEILALPKPVDAETILPDNDNIDITEIAGSAIDRADQGTPKISKQTGQEPIRHKVKRGETAYSIARLYGVSPRSLADWNNLSADLEVRENQFLLIPVVTEVASKTTRETAPGEGTTTPVPPSAVEPLPKENATTKIEPSELPKAPDLGSANAGRMTFPVSGRIIRDFQKGKSDGIDIAASAGASVKAADSGTVAAITQDTDQVPILVIRHAGNMMSVYANVDNITVEKGSKVKRGQQIAKVRKTANPFVHFELRKGFDSIDPTPYFN
ncbi:MAG: peptidoglycan DD-metalloendopeptidase family protein [Halocynthiibacter sp.]